MSPAAAARVAAGDAPKGDVAAIAVENQRDESVVVGGVEGGLPQGPAGFLAVVDLVGATSSKTKLDAEPVAAEAA